MSILVDVYSPAGNKLGDGPVYTCISASSRKVLDGVGNFTLSVSASDPRAKELLVNQNRVVIYIDQLGAKRELGRGIIEDADFSLSGAGVRRTISGPDELAELRDITVGVNRAYAGDSLSDILDDLSSLVSGWSVDASLTAPYSARFDAVSPLKVMQKIVGDNGLHLRQTTGAKEIEVGVFGTDTGLLLLSPDWITEEIYTNDDIALIKQFKLKRKSADIYNRIIPLGAGQNIDAALTLKNSSRSVVGGYAYDIQTRTGNDGRTEYYLEDAASIAQYGVREKYPQLRNVSAIANNDDSEMRAADALYDASVAYLIRNKDIQETYSVSIVKCNKAIRPGDQVWIVYKGAIETEDGTLTVENIDAYFWVLSVSESYSSAGLQTQLEISNVDQFQLDTAQIIIGALEDMRLQGMAVQPALAAYPVGPEQLLIDPSNSGKVQFPIKNFVFNIDSVLMRIRTQPFTATAKTAASGGGSSQTSEAGGGYTVNETSGIANNFDMIMMTHQGAAGSPGTLRDYQILGTDGNVHLIQMYGPAEDFKTSGVTLDHTHLIQFVIPTHSHSVTIPAHSHNLQ